VIQDTRSPDRCGKLLAFCFLLSTFCFLLSAVCCSCTALIDVARASGTRYSAALLVGTDAATLSHPHSWTATGVNNSNATNVAKKAVVTRAILNLATPAVNSAAAAISNP